MYNLVKHKINIMFILHNALLYPRMWELYSVKLLLIIHCWFNKNSL